MTKPPATERRIVRNPPEPIRAGQEGSGVGEHPKTGRAMTPAAALRRHVDWLEFALAAARSEETWRAARLDKATKKNREKRMARIAEVREEIEELAALLEAIRGLRARGARRTTATTTRKRSTGTASTSTTRRRGADPQRRARPELPHKPPRPERRPPRASPIGRGDRPRLDLRPPPRRPPGTDRSGRPRRRIGVPRARRGGRRPGCAGRRRPSDARQPRSRPTSSGLVGSGQPHPIVMGTEPLRRLADATRIVAEVSAGPGSRWPSSSTRRKRS